MVKLVSSDGKVLGSDEGIKLGSFDGEVIGTILRVYSKLGGLVLGDSLDSTAGKVCGSDEGIKLGSTDGEVLCTLLVNVDGIKIGFDFGTDMGSLDGSFDCFNDDKLERLLLGCSLGYSHFKVLGSDEGIKLGSTDGNVFFNLLVNLDVIIFGINVGTELIYLDGSFDGSNDGNIE